MKKVILIISLAIIAFLMINNNSSDMRSINAYLKQQVDRHKTPSIQYAFYDTDRILFEQQFGVKDLLQGEPVADTTTYHLFSVTKTLTAVAVLQLAQRGKLALSNPVSEYLPGFPYDKKITVAQLLGHMSGIPNPMPLKWIHLTSEHGAFNPNDFFKRVFNENNELDFAPGTKFRYSNLGYVLLGQLIESVSGLSYDDYVAQYLIQASGINNSDLSFDIDPTTAAVGYHKWFTPTNAALGFLIDKPKFMDTRVGRWKPFKPFYNNGAAYGGLFGSRRGLIKYAQALLKQHSPLLSDSFKEILFTEGTINGKGTGMSYSWFTGVLKGHRYLAHAGGGGGYYVELRLYPDLGVGSVILCNRSGMTDERMLEKTDRFFLTELAP
jgi:CubicO group peptidase (beta-lactamase class C family)